MTRVAHLEQHCTSCCCCFCCFSSVPARRQYLTGSSANTLVFGANNRIQYEPDKRTVHTFNNKFRVCVCGWCSEPFYCQQVDGFCTCVCVFAMEVWRRLSGTRRMHVSRLPNFTKSQFEYLHRNSTHTHTRAPIPIARCAHAFAAVGQPASVNTLTHRMCWCLCSIASNVGPIADRRAQCCDLQLYYCRWWLARRARRAMWFVCPLFERQPLRASNFAQHSRPDRGPDCTAVCACGCVWMCIYTYMCVFSCDGGGTCAVRVLHMLVRP